MNATDEDILAALQAIDHDEDVTVTSWEAKFIESVVYGSAAPGRELTTKQRLVAIEIVDHYA